MTYQDTCMAKLSQCKGMSLGFWVKIGGVNMDSMKESEVQVLGTLRPDNKYNLQVVYIKNSYSGEY